MKLHQRSKEETTHSVGTKTCSNENASQRKFELESRLNTNLHDLR
jgi:hypothetical protein